MASNRDLEAAVQLISAAEPSLPAKLGGSGDSGLSILSKDGRFVLFASMANNLTLTNNYNLVQPFRFNVFLRDNLGQTTILVSANRDGNGGNGDSFPTGISTNGQFVLFESSASDLVANDTNGVSDVFVRDMLSGTTALVSVSINGGSANGASRGSVLTPDGRQVAFASAADNLVTDDTNTIPDVFVRDLPTSTTTLVSVGATATNPTNLLSSSESPEITPDGRFVAFYSTATNLVSAATTAGEVYVRDLVARQTTWVSTNARAIFQSVTGGTNVISCNCSISDDGQYVAFEACTNAVFRTSFYGIVLRYGLLTGLTDVINTNGYVQKQAFELVHGLDLSPDGRFVAYVASMADTTGIYLWDAQINSNILVSVSLDNSAPTNGLCDSPVLSANGQRVAFVSSATNLVTNTLAGDFHVYVRDLPAGVTRLLDTDANGNGAGVDPTVVPAMSADGSLVVFDSPNLLPDNRHFYRDVFMRPIAAGTNILISASHPAWTLQPANGNSGLTSFASSSNGVFLAFYSEADNLVPTDTNGYSDVFVRNLVEGTNTLVSVNFNGNASANGVSLDPAISADGRYVAFTSRADDLVGNDTNRAQDVFVRDLQATTNVLVSISTNGVYPGNNDSYSPVISADGRYVLFRSKSSNLATGSFGSSVENLFLRDLQTRTTFPLTWSGVMSAAMTPDGKIIAFGGGLPATAPQQLYVWNTQLAARTYTNNSGFFPSYANMAISPDGQKIAYLTSLTRLYAANVTTKTITPISLSGTFRSNLDLSFSADGRLLTYVKSTNSASERNIYRYDFQLGTSVLISQNYNTGGLASGLSDSASISPNGRFIAYRSFATNLVPLIANSRGGIFIYDASNNATIFASINAGCNAGAADRSYRPVFSGDGRSLFFQSWAPDIMGEDFNNCRDIFALDLSTLPLTGTNDLGGTNTGTIFSVRLISGGTTNFTPIVSWPLAAGKFYQAQFKTNLNDAVWQNLPGTVTFVGSNGYIRDPAPVVGQRFYRIISNP